MNAAAVVGAAISRNPTLVGGSTAFLVALSFVSANALWYQPSAHPDAFFATRPFTPDATASEPEEHTTTIRIDRNEEAAERLPAGDPTVRAVQQMLKDLALYDGEPDGMAGPATRRAVEAYQRQAGLPATGLIDATLLSSLDPKPTAAITPQPRPQERLPEPSPERFQGADAAAQERLRKIQSGLREFGRKDITVDGVLGNRTRAAISEFQALFGLKVTGEPDEAVYAKMRKERLIQ